MILIFAESWYSLKETVREEFVVDEGMAEGMGDTAI